MSGTVIGSATDYLETALLQHSLAIASWPMPVAVYLGICITAPTDAAAGSPPPGGSAYVRMAVTFMLASGRSDLCVNSATLEFPAATADWGLVGWFEVWTALNGGNRLYWGAIVDPNDMVTPVTRQVDAGDILRVPIGAVAIGAD